MPLQILTIGLSPPGNVTAPVIVVEDIEELEGMNIRGKIVLIAPSEWTSYGKLAKTRQGYEKLKVYSCSGINQTS